MSLQQFEKNKHLLWRAGFGPSGDALTELETINERSLYDKLVNASEKVDELKVPGAGEITDMMGTKEPSEMDKQQKISEEKRRVLRKESAENI